MRVAFLTAVSAGRNVQDQQHTQHVARKQTRRSVLARAISRSEETNRGWAISRSGPFSGTLPSHVVHESLRLALLKRRCIYSATRRAYRQLDCAMLLVVVVKMIIAVAKSMMLVAVICSNHSDIPFFSPLPSNVKWESIFD